MRETMLLLRLVLVAAVLLAPRSGLAQTELQISRSQSGQVLISGTCPEPNVLEASTNLRDWGIVQKNTQSGAFGFVTSAEPGQRTYRLRALPAELTTLDQNPNGVFIAGEGFNTLQFAPSGKLGLIAWRNLDLVYRERSADGSWSEMVVAADGKPFRAGDWDEYRFQPQAALWFDTASRPHVFRVTSGGCAHTTRQSDGTWRNEDIPLPNAGSGVVFFAAELDRQDSAHLAFVNGDSPAELVYGSDRSGTWHWENVTTLSGAPRGFIRQSYAPRFFSMALDQAGGAHITFTREFDLPVNSGHLRPYSELAYASNRSGEWKVETVMQPGDSSGDAGMGASVAIGPDDQPAIASWFNDRVDTGSASWSALFYHHKDSSGTWTRTEVQSRPDNYISGDGEKGTGFAPYLRFDAAGRAHVLFSDHASEHFAIWGQDEYAGQIRHATLNGTEWQFETVFRQSSPLSEQMVYPAFAIGGQEIAFTGLERRTQFGPDARPRTVTSTYRFVFLTEPAR